MAGTPRKHPQFTFAIVSDTHIRPAELDESSPFPVNDLANDRARYAIAAIAKEAPDFVIHLGDMVHPLPHLPTYLDACTEAHDIFAPLSDAMHFVPGNHDIGDKPNPDAPAGPADDTTIAQYEAQFGASYYSFERQGCLFVVLNSSLVNSGTSHEAAQRTWLETTLEENRSRRTFLFSHYPPFIYAPDEQSHYDNYGEPGRSWLLALVARYEIECVFSGHVHQFFFNRAGGTSLYCLPATSFIRQDYAEMYAIAPPPEFGRNDTGKFGFTLIDVYAEGHRVRIVPTDGTGLAKDATPTPAQWQQHPETPLTVPLRHAWATPIDLPYNGPMEEFARKRTRNDYTLMRLQQMGLSRVRVPLSDLMDPLIRRRMAEYHLAGVSFAVFAIGIPDATTRDVIKTHAQMLTALEVVSASDGLEDVAADIAALSDLNPLPVFVGKSHSSKHEPKQGSKFAHSVSSGFKWESRETILTALKSLAGDSLTPGLVFQINLTDDLRPRLEEINAFAAANAISIAVNVRLADANPAVANFDDEAIRERVLAAVRMAPSLPALSLQLDTFVDVDRGYNPRHGLLDRHYNFRAAGRALGEV